MKHFYRTKKTKSILYRHCKKRAYRYEIELSKDIYNELNYLASKEYIQLIKQTNSKSIRLLIYENKYIAVVFDNNRKAIATFLPEDVIENNLINESKLNEAHYDDRIKNKYDIFQKEFEEYIKNKQNENI